MARDYYINGESLVKVKGFLGVDGLLSYEELGLTSDSIRITPRFIYQDVHIDDFGPTIPVEVMTMLADVTIRMTLVHYDPQVLNACMAEALGGMTTIGELAPAGTPLGGGVPIFQSGNHFISLNILSPVEMAPWRFPASYINAQPFEIPLGTDRSLVNLTWRAIPYQLPRFTSGVPTAFGLDIDVYASGLEIISSGVILWDNVEDTDVI